MAEAGPTWWELQQAARTATNPVTAAGARLNLAVLYREYGHGKLIATELGGLSDISPDLLRDPAVLPSASLEGAPQEKK